MEKSLKIKDITRSVISETQIRSIIGGIFTDGIILTIRFSIAAVGTDICDLLGHNKEKFNGLPLSSLTGESLIESDLRELLKAGSFTGHQVLLKDKTGNVLMFEVSGFYLGLIADTNDLIVLKFSNKSSKIPTGNPYATRYEFDDFIYATSHSLRGPLATLKGLINLLEINGGDREFIIDQMRIFAERLDNLLHKLIYFAESDKANEFSTDKLSVKHIAEKLLIYDNNPVLQKMSFREHLTESIIMIENGELTLTLLKNIKSFFSRIATSSCELTFGSSTDENYTEFVLTAMGIQLSEEQVRKVQITNFGYTEILNDPEFTDLYAAKKIILKLKGDMNITLTDCKASARITIPRTK